MGLVLSPFTGLLAGQKSVPTLYPLLVQTLADVPLVFSDQPQLQLTKIVAVDVEQLFERVLSSV